MVARTIPCKPRARDKPKPDEPLPSIPPEKMEKQKSVAEMLRHAKQQIALTRQYPGRTPPRK
jgi:hypothetical protein